MQIEKNKVVSIDYTLKNDAGSVIDSSQGAEPLVYLQGAENIIPALEQALVGKVAEDKMQISIEAVDGYGEYNKEMLQVVPRDMFQGVESIEVGMQFQSQTPEGVQSISIASVDGDQITVDGNHPLAGERLHFDVTIADVRDATEDELKHGHVHSEGCNH
jgi:FKBP-type peptidyl-prolyl cis-trans isomerase SlyD